MPTTTVMMTQKKTLKHPRLSLFLSLSTTNITQGRLSLYTPFEFHVAMWIGTGSDPNNGGVCRVGRDGDVGTRRRTCVN
jgi:hypothetical protein